MSYPVQSGGRSCHCCRPPNGVPPKQSPASDTAIHSSRSESNWSAGARSTLYRDRAHHPSPVGGGLNTLFGNVPAMQERAKVLVTKIGRRLEAGQPATRAELLVYEDLALYLLYCRYLNDLDGLVSKSLQQANWDRQVGFWKDFLSDFQQFFRRTAATCPHTTTQRSSLRASFRSSGPLPRSTTASSAARCRRPGFGRRSGSRSSRAT